MRAFVLTSLVILAASAPVARAADIVPVEEPVAVSDWRFQATIYGWLAGVSGDVGVRGLPPVSVDVTPWEAIEHLDGALMGSFLATHGDWMFLADLMWIDISADKNGLGGGAVNLDLKQLIASGLVGYELPLNIPNVDLSATAGFRYQHLKASLDIDTGGGVVVNAEGTKEWIDPTIGLSLHYDINDRWFVNAIGDIGGFGVGSKFTTQGFATIGYNWTKTISTALGYRVIYTDYDKNGFVFNTTEQGIFSSVGFHF